MQVLPLVFNVRPCSQPFLSPGLNMFERGRQQGQQHILGGTSGRTTRARPSCRTLQIMQGTLVLCTGWHDGFVGHASWKRRHTGNPNARPNVQAPTGIASPVALRR